MDEIWIGELIDLDGRRFCVGGFDPMSVPEQMVELADPATGESVRVPLARLDAAGASRTRLADSEQPQRAWGRGDR